MQGVGTSPCAAPKNVEIEDVVMDLERRAAHTLGHLPENPKVRRFGRVNQQLERRLKRRRLDLRGDHARLKEPAALRGQQERRAYSDRNSQEAVFDGIDSLDGRIEKLLSQ